MNESNRLTVRGWRRIAVGLLAALGLVCARAAMAHYVHIERELVQPDTFTFGMALTGPPFAYEKDGTLQGFEVEMAKGVAAAHGLALKIVPLPRSGLLAALADGKVDAINTLALEGDGGSLAQGRTDMRIVPYIVFGDYMMILRGNPFRIHHYADLSGETVAATAGSTAEAFAMAINRKLVAAGRAPMNIHSFAYQRDVSFPVDMGHAAAYFIQSVSAVGITRDPDSRTALVEGDFHRVRDDGFGVRSDHERIRDGIEHAIAAMVAIGKFARLREEFGLPRELSPYPR